METRVLAAKLPKRDDIGRIISLGVLLVVIMSIAGRAADIPVSTSSDLTVAIAQAQPGDTIVMHDGVWPDADILFSGNGGAVQPITLRAQTLGRVQLTGQ